MAKVALPDWAEEWVRGKCGCGARLCRPACYCGGHVVCSVSGWAVEMCDRRPDRGSSSDPTDNAHLGQ